MSDVDDDPRCPCCDHDDDDDAVPLSETAAVYMGIRGGGMVFLDEIRPSDFEPEVIARSLAYENRYAGNYGNYSVAQHAVLVAKVIEKALDGSPQEVLAGLHHDDAEAITGDMPAPVKRYLRAYTDVFDDLCDRIDRAIELRYHIDLEDPVVKRADDLVFHWEVMRLVPQADRHKYEPLPPAGKVLLPYEWFVPWSPEKAFAIYMDVHERCVRAIDRTKVPHEYTANAS